MKKKNKKITKKEKMKIIIFIVSFIIFRAVISDWEHFKQGLFGASFY